MRFIQTWLIIPVVDFWSRTYKGLAPRFNGLARGPPEYGERGAVSIGGIILMAIGMVFLAVGFIFLPISTTATEGLLNYVYATNTNILAANFTGFVSVVGITPLLILVGFVTAGVIVGMLGIKVIKGVGKVNADPGTLIMLGLTIVFIAIGLIVEPIALDGISSVIHNSGHGVNSSFTGYSSILLISPLLVHLSYVVGTVVLGFFGIKRLQSSASED